MVKSEMSDWYPRSSILLMVVAALVTFLPWGTVSQVASSRVRYFGRNQAAMDASPLHQVCAKCDKPATHSQEYRIFGTGKPSEGEPATYYFCDDHWPAPSSPIGGLSVKYGGGGAPGAYQFEYRLTLVGALLGFAFLLRGLVKSPTREGTVKWAGTALGLASFFWIWGYFGLAHP